MTGILPRYEQHHQVKILPEAVEAAVKLSTRYINDRNLPDKAIDLIDEASSAARIRALHVPKKLTEYEEIIKDETAKFEQALSEQDFALAGEIKREKDKL